MGRVGKASRRLPGVPHQAVQPWCPACSAQTRDDASQRGCSRQLCRGRAVSLHARTRERTSSGSPEAVSPGGAALQGPAG